MKVILQKNKWSCFACVAAMITGETLEDVIKFIGHDGSEIKKGSRHPNKYRGFTEYEINKYLADRGFTTGVVGVNLKDFKDITKYSGFQIQITMEYYPALIIAKSNNFKGVTHCLYWNGENLYDPYFEDPVEFKDYDLLSWWPVNKIQKEEFEK